MNELTKIDQGYRPESYWELTDPLQAILANVSGQARRQMITDFWNAGQADRLEAELLKDELNPGLRSQLGAIDPFFMGGEYLPRRLPDEVTLVRIELKSTTYDVIELRARRVSNRRIALRWVDEYDTAFLQPTDCIDRPFSFGELTDFIQASRPDGWCEHPLPLHYTLANAEYSDRPEELADFTSVSSDFYEDLTPWFSGLTFAWLDSIRPEDEEEDEEEEVFHPNDDEF